MNSLLAFSLSSILSATTAVISLQLVFLSVLNCMPETSMFLQSNLPRSACERLKATSIFSASKRFLNSSFLFPMAMPLTVREVPKISRFTERISVFAPAAFWHPQTSAFFVTGFLKIETISPIPTNTATTATKGTKLKIDFCFFISFASFV